MFAFQNCVTLDKPTLFRETWLIFNIYTDNIVEIIFRK